MKKNERKSVVRWIELYLEDQLKDSVPQNKLQAIIAQVKQCRDVEVEQIAAAFDDGRVAQKFENRCNGKAYYRLNYYDENLNKN